MSTRTQLQQVFFEALCQAYPNDTHALSAEHVEIVPSTQAQFGHFQCNSAMKLAKLLKMPPCEIADQWVVALKKRPLPSHEIPIFETLKIAGPGFINITLTAPYLAQQVEALLADPRLGLPSLSQKSRIVIDYSSPNIAKEMHVGHLRTTIIGECLAKIYEFLGHEVIRLNHVGDWGTQFGMLIAYLKESFSDLTEALTHLSATELVEYYKKAKTRFDTDRAFKKRSQLEVIDLQHKKPESIQIWQAICEISRQAFLEIYNLLNINLQERGESFYQDSLDETIQALESKNLITISNKAKCVYLPGFTNRDNNPLPLIIQKSDGGFNYATTDLAALRHRVNIEKANKIIYVVDAGQSLHLEQVFKTAQAAGFYDPQQITVCHVPFGLVLREDGKKFKTRSGDTERLIDLLNTAIEKAKETIQQRNPDLSNETLQEHAEILGINAVKYADLSCHRLSDYRFSYTKMLQFEGNTAAFLSYAYVRIKGIKRTVAAHNPNIETTLKNSHMTLKHATEKALAIAIVQFPDLLLQAATEYLPNRLTEYLFHLAEHFHAFFHQCRVEGTPEQNSRLLLCDATAKILHQGMCLLGLKPLERM